MDTNNFDAGLLSDDTILDLYDEFIDENSSNFLASSTYDYYNLIWYSTNSNNQKCSVGSYYYSTYIKVMAITCGGKSVTLSCDESPYLSNGYGYSNCVTMNKFLSGDGYAYCSPFNLGTLQLMRSYYNTYTKENYTYSLRSAPAVNFYCNNGSYSVSANYTSYSYTGGYIWSWK